MKERGFDFRKWEKTDWRQKDIWRPWTWGSHRHSRAVLQWPDTPAASSDWSSLAVSWKEVLTRNSTGEHRLGTASPDDLFNLTVSRSRVAELKQWGAGTGQTSWPRPPPVPYQASFMYWGKGWALEGQQQVMYVLSQERIHFSLQGTRYWLGILQIIKNRSEWTPDLTGNGFQRDNTVNGFWFRTDAVFLTSGIAWTGSGRKAVQATARDHSG